MRRAFALACLLAVVAIVGCRRGNNVIVPNRVLDRPLDVALTCMKYNTTTQEVEALPVEACDRPSSVSCSSYDETQLIAFIANSERNEVAMARRCDTTAAVVDMDGDTPGYQLIPVGQLPSHITATELGCRVVTSNAGSCDLSILDAKGLAGYALDLPPPEAPSGLVSKLQPMRSDGSPLGSRPGVVISVPDELSLAGASADVPEGGGASEEGPSESSGDGGTAEESGVDEGGTSEPPVEFSQCPPGKAESVWVTFPTCQLVAELHLISGQILQSRRFELEADGTVTVLDGGTAPDCPVDCPIAFDDEVPPTCADEGDTDGDTDGDTECREPVDTEGFFPTAIAPVVEFDVGDDSTIAPYPSLFIGGLGSDAIVEIQFDGEVGEETGQWVPAEDAQQITLEGAQGVHAIRPTPVLDREGGRQFLYVIAGDGSTHVVERFFDRGTFGNECDTQLDPTAPTADPLCNAIPAGASGQTPSPQRRPYAAGPGIRASLGASITDWTFFKVIDEDVIVEPTDPAQGDPAWSPFGTPGVIGVGVTSFGRVVLSVFDQLLDKENRNLLLDPVGVMDLTVTPHSLWPSLYPLGLDPTALPKVDDSEPDRSLPGPEDQPQELAPTIRRIDLAYAVAPDGEELSDERAQLASALGDPQNVDQLGRFDGEGIYETEAARVAVRDYATWKPVVWSTVWEGTLPRSRSSTGRLVCDTPGWENGTCKGGDAGESRLVDESASFCDIGVLPGDKVVLLGCTSDDECGLGQKCLQEPTAPSSSGGICVSSQAYEEDFQTLREVCAPFITDPCGSPKLEYVITDAFQNELWMRPMDISPTSHLYSSPRRVLPRPEDVDPEDLPTNLERPPDLDIEMDALLSEAEERYTCALPYGHTAATVSVAGGMSAVCTSDADCRGAESPARCVITQVSFDYAERYARHPNRDAPDFETDSNGDGIDDAIPVGLCEVLVGGCETDADCEDASEDDQDPEDVVHLCIDGVCRGPCTGGDPDCFECANDTECGHYGPDAICSDNKCMRPCESGSPDCTLARLPGPRCFPELVEYVVRLRDSFLIEGSPDVLFIPDRVVADQTTGRCREDPTVSNLLTSRIPLGVDERETFELIPDCANADQAAPGDPNPCRITRQRAGAEGSLFHTFAYNEEPVSAIRFSNPFMSMVIDLTDLRSLASEVEQFPTQRFPTEFRRFHRGRIPRGYRESFTAVPGYVPFSEPVVVATTVMVYPVRIVSGPEFGVAFIVDAGGRGGPAGVRGQLIRIVASAIDDGGMEDLSFLVR